MFAKMLIQAIAQTHGLASWGRYEDGICVFNAIDLGASISVSSACL